MPATLKQVFPSPITTSFNSKYLTTMRYRPGPKGKLCTVILKGIYYNTAYHSLMASMAYGFFENSPRVILLFCS